MHGYAFEEYREGLLVEGRGTDGKWVPCVIKRLNQGKLWDLHVASEFPGFELPRVPASLVRRLLGPGESDWYVDNAKLRQGGNGILYRLSKDMANSTTEYAPWGTLVVGSDEGDGWLKVSRGYLPMEIQGVPVLKERGRDASQSVAPPQAFMDWYQAREEAREEARSKAKKAPPPPLKLTYRAFETVKFTNSDGELLWAKVLTRGWHPNTYNLLVLPGQPGQYFVGDIPAEQLQKDHHHLPKHAPVDGESPLCQKQGCVELHMRTESGKERTVHAGLLVTMESLARQACAMLQLPWEACQQRVTLLRKGYALSLSMRTFDVGFKDGDIVDVELAPEA